MTVLEIPAALRAVVRQIAVGDDGSVTIVYAEGRVLRDVKLDGRPSMMSSMYVSFSVDVVVSAPPALAHKERA